MSGISAEAIWGSGDKAEVIEEFSRHVSSGKAAFFRAAGLDFVQGRREGAYLWDLAGQKKLIDCHSNGGVFNLGHRNPAVIEALLTGVRELDIGNHHLMSGPRSRLAKALAETSPGGGLQYSVFGAGGGEAIDLAIKVARGYTGRTGVISTFGGYHGHTGLSLATGDEKYRAIFGPQPPGFTQIPFNDLEALDRAMDGATAAVIMETIPATSGMVVPDAGYFPAVRKLCDERGVLLIIDEVQAGLGRTGRLWGIEHFGATPDIMVTGKGLSGGIYPISATIFRQELESVFHQDPFIHVSTFGGSELGCVVALKVLEISSDPAFLEKVSEMARIFREGFDELKRRHPALLTGLRQVGMMMGIEMSSPHCGPAFTRAAYDNGVLSVYANNDTRVAQLLPPLTIDRQLAAEILDRVDRALADVERLLG